jgi:hypothetical protein
MASLSRAKLLSAERSIRKPGTAALATILALDWIGKLSEHLVLSWFAERLKEQPEAIALLKWAMDHPFLLFVALAFCYSLWVVLKAITEESHSIAPSVDRHVEGYNATAGNSSPIMAVQGQGNNVFAPGGNINLHGLVSLSEPVLHLEPEFEMLSADNGSDTKFTLALRNTGCDVVGVRVFLDYFVAIKRNSEIIIKNAVRSGFNPSLTIDRLASNALQPVPLEFTQLPMMREVGANSGGSYLLGVKISVKFRRGADGKDFSLTRGYQTALHGRVLIPQEHFPVPFQGELANLLTFGEVVPHLDKQESWQPVVAEIKGILTGHIPKGMFELGLESPRWLLGICE